jgi:hypothetical protein
LSGLIAALAQLMLDLLARTLGIASQASPLAVAAAFESPQIGADASLQPGQAAACLGEAGERRCGLHGVVARNERGAERDQHRALDLAREGWAAVAFGL